MPADDGLGPPDDTAGEDVSQRDEPGGESPMSVLDRVLDEELPRFGEAMKRLFEGPSS